MIRRQIPQLLKGLRTTSSNQCFCNTVNINRVYFPARLTNDHIRYLSTPVPDSAPPEKETWLSRKVMNARLKFGLAPRSNAYYRKIGLLHFRSVERVNWKEYFTVFNMPDTFHSWFLVMELHMWMLNVRGNDEGKEGDQLKKYSLESMWDGAQKRARKLESYSPSGLRDSFDILHEEMIAAFVMYDYGLLTSDVALANALWYRFLEEKCDDAAKLELLVRHVRKQIHLLDQLSKEDIIDRVNITWLPLRDKTYA